MKLSFPSSRVDPKTVLEPYPNAKNSPLGSQKVKNYPKIKLNSKVRIEGIVENKSCSTTRIDGKTDFEPYPEPKNRPLGPQNIKSDP